MWLTQDVLESLSRRRVALRVWLSIIIVIFELHLRPVTSIAIDVNNPGNIATIATFHDYYGNYAIQRPLRRLSTVINIIVLWLSGNLIDPDFEFHILKTYILCIEFQKLKRCIFTSKTTFTGSTISNILNKLQCHMYWFFFFFDK